MIVSCRRRSHKLLARRRNGVASDDDDGRDVRPAAARGQQRGAAQHVIRASDERSVQRTRRFKMIATSSATTTTVTHRAEPQRTLPAPRYPSRPPIYSLFPTLQLPYLFLVRCALRLICLCRAALPTAVGGAHNSPIDIEEWDSPLQVG